jgi:hypothetical protein
MRARTLRLLRVIAVAVAIAAAAFYVLRWPSGWPAVRVNMPQGDVLALVGQPTINERGVNSHFWIEQRHLVRYELWIAFDQADRVVAFTIERRLGTAQSFYQQQLKGDLNMRSERSHR